jgi:hypothetical protein
MTKVFIVFFGLAFFVVSSDAAVYKGQKEFLKKCSRCHTGGQNYVASHTVKEWEKIFANDGKDLAALHLKNKKAKKSWKYFKGTKYPKKVKHLRQFFMEYAKDSGNVPCL